MSAVTNADRTDALSFAIDSFRNDIPPRTVDIVSRAEAFIAFIEGVDTE